jgi:hypothetical protein
MRYLDTELRNARPREREILLGLVRKIFDAHDPGETGLGALESTWRVWVRLELLVVLNAEPRTWAVVPSATISGA